MIAGALAASATVVLAGCGGGSDDDGSGKVAISAEMGPKGDPALVKGDPKAGPADQRIPITRKGVPTAIYAAPVREAEEGMRVRAIATVTLTKCAITDYLPNNRAHTACQGTKTYDYDPVEIETSFKLVGGGDKPDLSGPSQVLGETQTTKCTTAIHHCSISQDYEVTLTADEIDAVRSEKKNGYNWMVFEATAKSPKAKGCARPKPSQCNVLAVETQKGTAMYWIQATGDIAEAVPDLPRDTTPATDHIDVLPNHSNKNKVRRAVYSIELGPGEPIGDLVDRQMEIDSLVNISEKLPMAPDVAGYVVLSDKPTGIKGRYLISNTYDSGKTGNNGGNCDKSCKLDTPSVVTSILPCDVEANRRYVNLVLASSRAAAKPGERVQVEDGGYIQVTRAYPAEANENPKKVPSSCQE